MHRSTRRFWQAYDNLPSDIKITADKNFDLLKRNHFRPSLQFKRVGARFWLARVGLSHRALAIEDGNDYIWIWIGSHDDYDRLIK